MKTDKPASREPAFWSLTTVPGPRTSVGVALLLFLVSATAPALQFEARYQDRGNRREGLRSIPVSGEDIELVSARLADQDEEATAWTDSAHLRFYLPPERGDADITIRQLRSRDQYYWLDTVRPDAPWQTATTNEFTWPTADVIATLPRPLDRNDLGVVVRLDDSGADGAYEVAPARLFSGSLSPAGAPTYRFTFKANGRARVATEIYAGQGDEPIRREPPRMVTGGSPFSVDWAPESAEEGWYRVRLSGVFADGTVLAQDVRFFHRR